MVYRLKLVSDNVWNRSARPSDLPSKCAESFSENKKKFLGGTWLSSNVFGFRAQKLLTSDDLFAALLTKLHFASPEHNLIIFFSINSQFLHQFWDLKKKLIFSRKIIVAVAKSAFYVYRWQFDENWISAENCNRFFITSSL